MNSAGTVFQITLAKAFATLYNFCSQTGCTDGANPYGGLFQGTDGTLYGTDLGSLASYGIIYSLNMGLGAFVEVLPAFGKAGANVAILGSNLTGATGVTFNGMTATFTVVSNTEIKATVPTGATTGKIQVTTPAGTLSSNATFRVIP